SGMDVMECRPPVGPVAGACPEPVEAACPELVEAACPELVEAACPELVEAACPELVAAACPALVEGAEGSSTTTGVAAWRPRAVLTGIRQRSFPSAAFRPITPCTTNATSCRDP